MLLKEKEEERERKRGLFKACLQRLLASVLICKWGDKNYQNSVRNKNKIAHAKCNTAWQILTL